ncbi:MAG: hypothetical protein LKM45_06935, partial [Wolbachia endosymbiont of Alcedoecus sp.]|nr:hypothetical protein [Wolbachia endosymbiont of Alcedoecus sp.]
SYQQMHKNEEISGADITGQANKAVNDAKGNLVGKDEVVSTFLNQLKQNQNLVSSVKTELGIQLQG